MRYHILTFEGHELFYNTADNSFCWPNGEPIPVKEKGLGRGSGVIKKRSLQLRISLGMACNMQCGYCSEKSNRTEFARPLVNVQKYAKALVRYIDKHFNRPDHICLTFWGGEPLLYADVMHGLHAELSGLLEGRILHWGLSTNGALLTGKRFRWLIDNSIAFGVSYDGPGQYVRSPDDILAQGTEQFENIQCLMDSGYSFSFNPVLHQGNPSLAGYEAFMQERFQRDLIPVGDAPYMRWYNASSEKFALTPDQIQADMYDRISRICSGRPLPGSFSSRLVRSLKAKNLVPYPCTSTNKEDYLAVDLNGDIWGCHNNVGQKAEENGGNLYGGNIYADTRVNIPYVALTERRKKRCPDCLLRYMCGGTCCLSPSRYTEQNCTIAWHLNFPVFFMMVLLATEGGAISCVKAIKE